MNDFAPELVQQLEECLADDPQALRSFRASLKAAETGTPYKRSTADNEPVLRIASYNNCDCDCTASPCGCTFDCTADGSATGHFFEVSVSTDQFTDRDCDDGIWSCDADNQLRCDFPVEFGAHQVVTAFSDDPILTAQARQDINCWLTFRNVNVEPEAKVHKAQIVFNPIGDSQSVQDSTGCNAVIRGHCSADSTTNPEGGFDQPSQCSGDASSNLWPRTATEIEWLNVGTWTGDSTTNAITPNIACVIQELLARPGWASGNAMKIFVEDNASVAPSTRRADDNGLDVFGEPTGTPPKLQLWYHYEFNEDGTGGAVCGGSADVTSVYNSDATGGVVVNGQATFPTYHFPEGGVELAGEMAFKPTIEGGFELEGEPEVFYGFRVDVEGGAELLGDVTVNEIHHVTPSGGVEVEGNIYVCSLTVTVAAGAVSEYLPRFYLPVSIPLQCCGGEITVLDGGGKQLDFEVRQQTECQAWLYIKTELHADADNTFEVKIQ